MSLEDLEFLPPFQEWEFPVDEFSITKCSSEKYFSESGAFVEDVLEEIDNGFGLDVGCEWLTDRVNFSSLELEFPELVEFELPNDLPAPETQGSATEDTESTMIIGPSLEELLAGPVSPEQCVPESAGFSPVSSPSHFHNASLCSSDGEEIVMHAQTSPKQKITPCDTEIGVIFSDTAKIAKTLRVKEKDCATTKHHRVQPKVKTVTQRKRKQVQNRDAATRYRVKKKEECDFLFKKAEELEKENEDLTKTVGSLTQEIEYLRKLMVEVYKVKLLKSLPVV